MKNKKRIILFTFPFVWMGVIFFFSSRQRVSVSENYLLSFAFFKTLHLIEYGVLYTLWKLALGKSSKATIWAAALAIVYGAIDEIHQTFVPTREGRARDVLIDSLGVYIFAKYFYFKIEKLIENSKVLCKIFVL